MRTCYIPPPRTRPSWVTTASTPRTFRYLWDLAPPWGQVKIWRSSSHAEKASSSPLSIWIIKQWALVLSDGKNPVWLLRSSYNPNFYPGSFKVSCHLITLQPNVCPKEWSKSRRKTTLPEDLDTINQTSHLEMLFSPAHSCQCLEIPSVVTTRKMLPASINSSQDATSQGCY